MFDNFLRTCTDQGRPLIRRSLPAPAALRCALRLSWSPMCHIEIYLEIYFRNLWSAVTALRERPQTPITEPSPESAWCRKRCPSQYECACVAAAGALLPTAPALLPTAPTPHSGERPPCSRNYPPTARTHIREIIGRRREDRRARSTITLLPSLPCVKLAECWNLAKINQPSSAIHLPLTKSGGCDCQGFLSRYHHGIAAHCNPFHITTPLNRGHQLRAKNNSSFCLRHDGIFFTG